MTITLTNPPRPYTLGIKDRQRIRNYLKTNFLPVGMGNAHRACSIAAINLALNGELTDDVPRCMDTWLGNWIIGVQDNIPEDVRNSDAWKILLPYAAGTAIADFEERVKLTAKRQSTYMDWFITKIVWVYLLPTARKELTEAGLVWLMAEIERVRQLGAYPYTLNTDRQIFKFLRNNAEVEPDETATAAILFLLGDIDGGTGDVFERILDIVAEKSKDKSDQARRWARLNVPDLLRDLILA